MGFQKRVEDFICEHCGHQVAGSGYTNHCPQCLWSKHVDIEPGDRAAACGGMMAPTAIEGSTGNGYMVRQKCEKCGFERRNGIGNGDSTKAVLALIAKRA